MTTAVEAAAPSTKRKWLTRERREAILFYLFISPWLIGLLVFTIGPIIASLVFSLTDYAIIASPEWAGISNYRRAFTEDRLFWKSLWNTFYYVGLGVPLRVIFAFLLASLLNAQIKGRVFYRIAYYVPSIIPGVASAVLWIILLNPKLGLVNLVLGLFGIPTINWLGNPAWSKPALIMMSLWGVGGSMVIYLAGLQGIPDSLYEAAEIDGASRWRKFWNVTIPLMTPTILFNLVTQIIGSFQIFGSAFIMTGGGPLNSTRFYMLHLFDYAFSLFRMGYASALAWILLIIILVFTLLVFKWSQAWVFYSGGGEQ
jgi:multiple sugar transport system permease protein